MHAALGLLGFAGMAGGAVDGSDIVAVPHTLAGEIPVTVDAAEASVHRGGELRAVDMDRNLLARPGTDQRIIRVAGQAVVDALRIGGADSVPAARQTRQHIQQCGAAPFLLIAASLRSSAAAFEERA
jgi:hypothetical protein